MKNFTFYSHDYKEIQLISPKKFKNWGQAIKFAEKHNENCCYPENLCKRILGEKQTFELF